MTSSRKPSVRKPALAVAVTGAVAAALTALAVDTTPAAAQQRNPLVGRWSCQAATHNTRNGFREARQYVLLLYANYTFRAQGRSQRGMQFVAGGRWSVSRSNGAYWLSANGDAIIQMTTGQRIRGKHSTFGRVYNTRHIAWRNLAPGGVQITIQCRR